ncbi:BphX family protein [Microbacterium sp. ET2]|uniref:BphX family protein n=1 Tax=Microbacterium albipurpureum TaxID=3050384 RepID=UPI00259CF693|nr:BphX family protein [Microbacterium sp. ET2 (Ac-2212)]WJL94789.1 BphX family protein [Microbacterium sp. ET2 (Ac-2212)]
MTSLRWWFRSVGLVNIVLGILWLPALNAARLELSVPGWDAPIGGTAYRGFLDYTLLFSLDLLVLGAFLVATSFRPRPSRTLAWLAIALSAIRGILDDIYMIAAGYPLGAMLGFIALHATIIITGLFALRAASRDDAGVGRRSTARPLAPTH